MSVTVRIDENDSVRITDAEVDAQPPDRLEFAVQGTLRLAESILGEFEGATLHPSTVTVGLDDSQTVDVDLTDGSSLRLESVDVGIATPDTDDLIPERESLTEVTSADATSVTPSPDVLSFTVEGVVEDVPPETVEDVATESPTLEAVTFAVDDVVADGGSEPDVVLELTLFGYGVVVRQDGRITVSSSGRVRGLEFP